MAEASDSSNKGKCTDVRGGLKCVIRLVHAVYIGVFIHASFLGRYTAYIGNESV